MKVSSTAKSSAALIALFGAVTLVTRVYLRMEQGESLFEAFSFLTQFFTILTNFLIVVMFTLIATGRAIAPRLVLAGVVAIACVGLIYHLLLAHLENHVGLAFWADHGVHTFVPAFAVIWWLAFGTPEKPSVGAVGAWVIWPLTYFAYVLIRAIWSNFYPYPFVDLPQIGWARLAINSVGVSLVFVAIGLILTFCARMIRSAPRHA